MSKPKKMQQQTFKIKNDIRQSMPMTRMIYWTVMGILLLQQIKSTDAVKYSGDSCETKSTPGICKEWSECPIIKTLIERGEYTNRQVVSCGFGVREELICCPVVRTESKIETTSESTDRVVIASNKTQEPVGVFGMDLLENQNTTTTTTAAPDFWLDLLTTSKTPTTLTNVTTTTTMKPLMVREKRLNESSEYFDFNALLSGNQLGSQKRQTNSVIQNNQQNRGFVNPNNNRRPNVQNGGFVNPNNNNNNRDVNLNTGPVKINQWNFDQTTNNERVNNGRGHQNNGNGNSGNNGRGHQNNGNGNSGNNERGQQNNDNKNSGSNGRGQQNNSNKNSGNNGRGQQNNFRENNARGNNGQEHNGGFRGNDNGHGQNRNVGHNSNQNMGLIFPQDNKRSQELNNFNDNISPNRRPGRPVNNIIEQNPNIMPSLSNNNENDKVDELIKNVFGNTENNNLNLQTNIPTEQNKVVKPNADDFIKNIFEVPSAQNNPNPPLHTVDNPQSVVWLQPQNNHHNLEEYKIPHNSNRQVEFINSQRPNNFQTIPVIESHDDLPSTNFIQQPVIVETWNTNPVHKPEVDPIQMVYENLVNSGVDIIKLEADNVPNAWHQQQQFVNRPQNVNQQQFISAQFGQQQFIPEANQPQFVQQPINSPQFFQKSLQQFVEQPQTSQQFIQKPSHQFVQQPQTSTQFIQQPLQQFVEQPQTSQQFIQESQIRQQPSHQFVQQPQTSQQFIQQPLQQFHEQPQASQQFIQQSEFGQQPSQLFVPQPQTSQQLMQQPLHKFVEQPLQIEPNQKETSSAQQPVFAKSPNVQSPPTHILDPFKPFEFRPPPEDEISFSEDNNSLSPNPTKSPPSNAERPAVRACRRIENGLIASLSTHILGGTPAILGEFPHMAAIGYSRIGGNDRPPYDIRCGGTLIDKRFVLTAAHCVSERESEPSIVRLGVVNFTDVNQMKDAVEIRIKNTFIHDDYKTRLTYNDIAILELEREVETSEYIYPVCLYTNEKDPDTKIKLWVSGWGTINTTTRSFSNILLKAPLHTSPLERCNQSFIDYGLNRRIPEGVVRSQFCAEDKDQIRDACQGDSGGPLHLVVDESYKNYRLVGVVSSGFGCASSTPGLYTRVAAFLDFIEKIVWPNGGE